MPDWTPINKGPSASVSLANLSLQPTGNTTVDLLSPSAHSNESPIGANSATDASHTQSSCSPSSVVHEHQAMMPTPNNPNRRPGMAAPHGRRSGANQVMTPTMIKGESFQRLFNGIAHELHNEPDDGSDDYGAAVLCQRPLGQWYHQSSASG